MPEKRPCEPEPRKAAAYADAEALVEGLWEVTQQILAISSGEDLPLLGQKVMQRGNVIEQLQDLAPQSFTEVEWAKIQAGLNRCRELDQEIEARMRGFQAHIQDQLKSLKQSQAMLGKYQSGLEAGFQNRLLDA